MTDYQTIAQGRPLPDESTFREWLRVYYNDLEANAPYKSTEEKAYQSIIGHILEPGSGADLEDGETWLDVIKMGINSEMIDEPHTQGHIDLLMEAYNLIEEYEHLVANQV
jgi:hypothetical protein